MMSSLPELFHLKQGNTILAVLKRCKPVEMFWLGCEFEPTDAFEQCYAKLREADVTLFDVQGNRTTDNFIMHITVATFLRL